MSITLAAWGAFLRPAFDDVLGERGGSVVASRTARIACRPRAEATPVRSPAAVRSRGGHRVVAQLKAMAVPGAGSR